MNYKYSHDDAFKKYVFGVDIAAYDIKVSNINVVYETMEVGRLEEFCDDVSTHVWFIIDGTGTFVIDDEKVEAQAKDVIVVPPKKRIHYFGNMKMVLITTPGFVAQNEHHVRDVAVLESPYST
jgi:mannose-6-phosphate isomerase-like protein (cupin superfamily)